MVKKHMRRDSATPGYSETVTCHLSLNGQKSWTCRGASRLKNVSRIQKEVFIVYRCKTVWFHGSLVWKDVQMCQQDCSRLSWPEAMSPAGQVRLGWVLWAPSAPRGRDTSSTAPWGSPDTGATRAFTDPTSPSPHSHCRTSLLASPGLCFLCSSSLPPALALGTGEAETNNRYKSWPKKKWLSLQKRIY